MTGLEKIGADMARLALAVPAWEPGSGKNFLELRRSFREEIVGKARDFLRASQEAHRK